MSQVSPDTVIFTDFQRSLCEMWGVLLWRSLKNGNSDTEWGKETVFPKPVTRVHWSITLQALVHLLLQDYKSVHIAIIHRWENHGTGQVGLNWDHTSAKRQGLCASRLQSTEKSGGRAARAQTRQHQRHIPSWGYTVGYGNTQLDSQNILAWLYFLQFFCEFLIFFLCLM